MHAVEHERHHRIAALQAGRAQDLRAVDLLQPVQQPLRQRHLVRVRRRPVERRHPCAGGAQADRRADRRRAGLEAARRRRPGRLGDGRPGRSSSRRHGTAALGSAARAWPTARRRRWARRPCGRRRRRNRCRARRRSSGPCGARWAPSSITLAPTASAASRSRATSSQRAGDVGDVGQAMIRVRGVSSSASALEVDAAVDRDRACPTLDAARSAAAAARARCWNDARARRAGSRRPASAARRRT